ncbi:MAG: hypothetical protein NPIRA04_24910 [Nitrospirales bacterium]|nr:MAG: hypothetical protein NPIRA04_24910 [Nitrospirales bacterium]
MRKKKNYRDNQPEVELFTWCKDDHYLNGNVNFLPGKNRIAWEMVNWELYAQGYKAAGDYVVESITEFSQPVAHSLVYPVLFLYRHYLELELKSMIENGKQFSNSNIERNLDKEHRLKKLWEWCREILENIRPVDDKPPFNMKLIEDGINQFVKLDPNSQNTRYPRKKKGKQDTQKEIEQHQVHLGNLKKGMSLISTELENAHNWICITAQYS